MLRLRPRRPRKRMTSPPTLDKYCSIPDDGMCPECGRDLFGHTNYCPHCAIEFLQPAATPKETGVA